MKIIAPYVGSFGLASIGLPEVGAVVFTLAVLRDWKFWLLCIAGFALGMWLGE